MVITESAANKYREILAQENKTGWGLRFIPRAADSTGNRYYIEYSEKPKEGDKVFESQGIQIHIDSAHAQIFLGSILNYHSGDGPHSVGFHISKPKAISRFGIGYSPVIQPISIGASSSQTASAIPSLIIEPAASSATATTTASATGFQANTQPDSPVTPPETKPDEKRPDPVPSISQEMSVSPGTF